MHPGEKSERVTVSLTPSTAAQLRAAAAAAGTSVSAYVAAAVIDRTARDAGLARWRAAVGEPDPKGVAWARNLLVGEAEQHQQAS